MKTLTKKMYPLLSVFIFIFLISGLQNSTAAIVPDYSGKWEITFFDASGKVEGVRTITISGDGAISDKINLELDRVVYLTEISAIVTSSGKLKDGSLTNTDKLNMVGVMTGSFTETEGKGEWKNYYGKSGTWTAKRSDKKDRQY